MNKMKICIAQIEVIPANPQLNTHKILHCIEKAKRDGAEIIVFSELCISGYLLGDTWERDSFLNECMDCLDEVRQASNGITVVIGSVDIDRTIKNEDGRVRKYNTCFVMSDQKIIQKTIKTLQPNYREFDDNRHFYDNRKACLDNLIERGDSQKHNARQIIDLMFCNNQIKIGKNRIAFSICEDFWDADYTISPIDGIKKYCSSLDSSNSPKLIINISCSPYTQGKNNKRNRVFSNHAKIANAPIIYVNNVGIQNNGKTIYTFDGNSCIYDRNGNRITPYTSFKEGCDTIEIDLEGDFAYKGYDEEDNIKMTHDAIVYGTKRFMEQMGINKVVIGASGGIDSAVVAVIMSKILRPDQILLVNMPSSFNSQLTKDAAMKLAQNIGCSYKIIPIQKSVDLTKRQLKKVGLSLSDLAIENIQARDRSSRILAACSASFGGVFTCNGNKSELAVGYTTMLGDLSGFMAPLGDIWKTQVYELAHYINNKAGFNLIPRESIDVKPSAELNSNQQDPFVYSYLDKILASFIERWDRWTPEDVLKSYENGTLEIDIKYDGRIRDIFKTDLDFINDLERCWKLYSGISIAKRIQAPPIIGISRRPVAGFDLRETQIPIYYTKKYYELRKKILKL